MTTPHALVADWALERAFEGCVRGDDYGLWWDLGKAAFTAVHKGPPVDPATQAIIKARAATLHSLTPTSPLTPLDVFT